MLKLTPEQIQRARSAFLHRDKNKDGTLTVEELTTALRPFLSDETLEALLAQLNPDGDAEITWEEFQQDYANSLKE